MYHHHCRQHTYSLHTILVEIQRTRAISTLISAWYVAISSNIFLMISLGKTRCRSLRNNLISVVSSLQWMWNCILRWQWVLAGMRRPDWGYSYRYGWQKCWLCRIILSSYVRRVEMMHCKTIRPSLVASCIYTVCFPSPLAATTFHLWHDCSI